MGQYVKTTNCEVGEPRRVTAPISSQNALSNLLETLPTRCVHERQAAVGKTHELVGAAENLGGQAEPGKIRPVPNV